MKKKVGIGIAVGGLAVAAVTVTGCSAGSPQAVDNPSTTRGHAVQAASLRDDPGGCTPVQSTNISAAGWDCIYNGDLATVTVPAGEGISEMAVTLAGGQGGNSDPASGGYGSAVKGTIPVTGGQTVTINVGSGAATNEPGQADLPAAAGGTAGCSDGGAGGAASSIAVDGTVVAVAGGGGGGGAQGIFPKIDDGGAGGTGTVNNGDGHGGTGPGSGDHGKGGGGGSTLSAGGNGHHGSAGGGCSGGGGGGYSGGGAGGAGSWGGGGGAGGGAGGSYLSPTATSTSMSPANAGGDGNVTVRWLQ
jgi:hypothetical protein